jgi:sigma-B regulation protein RsbU (phosphoserine phosphatase)
MKELADCRILIVDDVRANVDVLVEALRNESKLSVALNGESALRSVEKNPPDLVLLDIMMPGIDGYEVCRRIRANPASREIPVMFLSALEDVKNKAQGFEAGGNDYLSKPFEVLEVKARVRSLLKAKAYSDSVKEKIASELRIAKEIQLGILPADITTVGSQAGLDVHALLEPAKEVGGDLYEVLGAEDGKLVIVLGDVSGKGIPASLFMAVTMTLVRTLARSAGDPGILLRQVNDALATQNPRNMFVTVFCAIYDPQSHELTYASAGHPPPIRVHENRADFLALKPGMVAGVFPGLTAETQSVTLQPGDAIIMYTDGVNEAFDAGGEMFGDERLRQNLDQTGLTHANDLTTRLLNAVRQHAGEHPQSDDIAILSVRRPA